VRQLSRALGQPVDACLAACLECGGVEEAAIRLLAQTTQPKSDGHTEDAVRRLSEVSGRSLEECRAALHSHGRADDAAAYLISLTPQAPEGTRAHVSLALASSATPERPAPREPLLVPSAEPSEQATLSLAGATGSSVEDCRVALRAHRGRMDDAAAYLLGLPCVALPPKAPLPPPDQVTEEVPLGDDLSAVRKTRRLRKAAQVQNTKPSIEVPQAMSKLGDASPESASLPERGASNNVLGDEVLREKGSVPSEEDREDDDTILASSKKRWKRMAS